MLSANLVKTTGYKIGDTVEVLTTLVPKKEPYTLVGIVGYGGGRDSLAGETSVFFTEPVAQKLMLGETGVFNTIDVKAADGTSLTELRDRIKSTLGEGYDVKTGKELASDSADDIKQGLQFFTYLLLGFAGIALFVGTFLILNTFSIIVAQRTRELALFRAMGAGRGQVIRSVLTEAVVIGGVSSVIGLLLGIGVGALLAGVLGRTLSGGSLQLAGLGVPPAAIIARSRSASGVTVVAALLPAIRASRIPPVAAMRDTRHADRPLTVITFAAVVLAAGAVVLGLGLAGKLGGGTLGGVLGGLLTCFVGVALLTPIVSRPIVGILGRALSWTAAGALGRRNSARNPRRTAITAPR
jgi:putative ABC transport system permease protein